VRLGCPFVRSGWGGRWRRPGWVGSGGNWHLQWNRYQNEGSGRKCGRVKGVIRGPTSRVHSMAREVGGGRHGA
jgi:hypothetical protein